MHWHLRREWLCEGAGGVTGCGRSDHCRWPVGRSVRRGGSCYRPGPLYPGCFGSGMDKGTWQVLEGSLLGGALRWELVWTPMGSFLVKPLWESHIYEKIRKDVLWRLWRLWIISGAPKTVEISFGRPVFWHDLIVLKWEVPFRHLRLWLIKRETLMNPFFGSADRACLSTCLLAFMAPLRWKAPLQGTAFQHRSLAFGLGIYIWIQLLHLLQTLCRSFSIAINNYCPVFLSSLRLQLPRVNALYGKSQKGNYLMPIAFPGLCVTVFIKWHLKRGQSLPGISMQIAWATFL